MSDNIGVYFIIGQKETVGVVRRLEKAMKTAGLLLLRDWRRYYSEVSRQSEEEKV